MAEESASTLAGCVGSTSSPPSSRRASSTPSHPQPTHQQSSSSSSDTIFMCTICLHLNTFSSVFFCCFCWSSASTTRCLYAHPKLMAARNVIATLLLLLLLCSTLQPPVDIKMLILCNLTTNVQTVPSPERPPTSVNSLVVGLPKTSQLNISAWELLRWMENRTDEEASVEGNGSV